MDVVFYTFSSARLSFLHNHSFVISADKTSTSDTSWFKNSAVLSISFMMENTLMFDISRVHKICCNFRIVNISNRNWFQEYDGTL